MGEWIKGLPNAVRSRFGDFFYNVICVILGLMIMVIFSFPFVIIGIFIIAGVVSIFVIVAEFIEGKRRRTK